MGKRRPRTEPTFGEVELADALATIAANLRTRPIPQACRWLNFRGQRSYGPHAIGQVVGPNTTRERLTCVEARYDPVTDRTRLGYAYGDHRYLADFTIQERTLPDDTLALTPITDAVLTHLNPGKEPS